EHIFFFDGAYGAGGQGNGGGHTKGIAREAKLAKKIMHAQNGGNRRWLMFRLGGEPHAAFVNVEERVGRRALFVDVLFVAIARDLAAQAGSGRETGEMGRSLLNALHESLGSWWAQTRLWFP